MHAETIVCKQKLKNIAKFAPLFVRLVLRRTCSRRTADLDTGKTRRASGSDREEEEEEENSHEEMALMSSIPTNPDSEPWEMILILEAILRVG